MGARQSLDGFTFAKVPERVRLSVITGWIKSLGIDPSEVTADGVRIEHRKGRHTLLLTLKAMNAEGGARLPMPSESVLKHEFAIDIIDDLNTKDAD